MRHAAAGLVLLLIGFGIGCASLSLGPTWIVVESPRFEIYSTFSAEESKTLARELERFHALIYTITSAPRRKNAVPTRIFAFSQRSQYLSLAPPNTAGVFMADLRQNIVLTTSHSTRLDVSQIILHEYVHQVLRNGAAQVAPVWYDEGMAEFLSTVEPEGESLAIGRIPDRSGPWLQAGDWLTFERVISTRVYSELSLEDRAMFYAQSWALVHYLTFDREPGSVSISQGMSRYLDFLAVGTDPADAFATAFGESTVEVGKQIRKKLSSGVVVLGYRTTDLVYDDREPGVRPPAPGEIELRLGELKLARGEATKAEADFRTVLAADPNAARANAGLGVALTAEARFDEAEALLLRAVELGPADPLNHLDLGDYYFERAMRQPGSLVDIRADLEAARGHYQKARELDESLPEAWVMLGRTYLVPGEDPALALKNFEEAYRRHPSSSKILGHLAEAHLARGDDLTAREYVRRMITTRRDGAPDETVDDVVETIRNRRAAVSRRFEGGATSGGST